MTRRGSNRVLVGTSGYQYDHWVGPFYPERLPKKQWFEYYAERFATLEVNGTFYSLPKRDTVARWAETAPEGFRYVVKFSRYGSHIKRLKDPDASLPPFFEAVEPLHPVCAGVLLQLPPNWRPNVERLDAFLQQAPSGWRWTVEVRDERWLCEDLYEVLRRHNAALCWHDLLEDHPLVQTADWTYRRFHGTDHGGRYSRSYLEEHARAIDGEHSAGRDCYVFFNNDRDGHAPRDALWMQQRITG